MKLFFKREREIKTFSNKNWEREFITSKSVMKKDVFLTSFEQWWKIIGFRNLYLHKERLSEKELIKLGYNIFLITTWSKRMHFQLTVYHFKYINICTHTIQIYMYAINLNLKTYIKRYRYLIDIQKSMATTNKVFKSITDMPREERNEII